MSVTNKIVHIIYFRKYFQCPERGSDYAHTKVLTYIIISQ